MAEEKQHQALYRRYRPQTPAEVLGQDHVVRALTGAIREGRLHHAFLFCGPRGTGKTSTARILAKMVNCEQGPTAEPCGTCTQCVAIREGQHLDVVEIDAASHGGVEDARELRERAPTAPVMGREKVYIIDEAQRLTAPAFDALLKLFEEPPPGVRFVLATTEPQKMPATIVGRCQRFDFRRLTSEGIAALLQRIASSEGVALEASAAHTIARQAEGSARDALSMLDQASVMGGAKVDDDVVQALLGAPRAEVQHELADAVAVGDARSAFEIVNRLVQDGQDLRTVTAETLGHFRNLLLVQTAPGQDDLLDVAADEYDHLRAQASKFTPAELARVISLLLAAQTDMRWTTSPRLSLELALVRATMPETDPQPAGLMSRIERLERLGGIDASAGVEAGGDARGTASPPAAASKGSTSEGSSPAAPDGAPSASPPASPKSRSKAPSKAADAAEARPGRTASAAEAGPSRPSSEGTKPAEADTKPAAGEWVPRAAPPSVEPTTAAATGNVDVAMLRRGWPSLMEHLQASRQAILRAVLESATVTAYDGETLEIAFPPGQRVGPRKVEERQDELRAALAEIFGIAPRVSAVVRDTTAPAAESFVEIEDAPDEAEALRRVQEMLGAKVAPQGED